MGSSSGFGQAHSYGQQGSNPWFNRQQPQSNYGQPYNTSPYQAEYRGRGVQNEPGGWGDQWTPSYPQQGYSGYPQAPAGKGRGMGGIGGGIGGGIAQQQAGQLWQQQNRGWDTAQRGYDKQMEFHQRLLQQRQLEEALGADPGWSWFEPFTRPQMASMSYAQPGAGATRTEGMYGPYGNRGY